MSSSVDTTYSGDCATCWKRRLVCASNVAGHFSGCNDHQRRVEWIDSQTLLVERTQRFNRYYVGGLGCLGLALMAAWVATGG